MMKLLSAFVLTIFLTCMGWSNEGAATHLQGKSHRVPIFPAAMEPVSITGPGLDNILTFVFQDFDGVMFPPAGWTSQGSGSSVWTRSTDASGYGIGVAAAFADFYSIGAGTQFSLVTPNFPPSVEGDSVKFDHAYATYQTENDRLQISTSTNSGTTWTTLITLDGGVSGPLVTAPPRTAQFIPTSTQWATKRYALPVGTTNIRFTGISAYGNNLFLDNVIVGTPFTDDVGPTSVDAPRSSIAPGAMSPKVTVRNYGLTAESFPITLTITPGGYTSTQNVTDLAPGTTRQVTFSEWNPSVGSYDLSVVSELGADLNAPNDTLRSSHIVSDVSRAALLEYCTGAWCQWCPCGDQTAEALLNAHPDMVILAYHGPAGTTGDPWSVYNGNSILDLLGFSGYPTANFDRQNAPGDYTTWTGFCDDRYGVGAPTPITIELTNHTFNATSRQLDVSVAITSNCALTSQYKVNFVITEDNLMYAQTGNTSCPGSTSWVHNWVVRTMANTAQGENVNAGAWTPGQTITKTLTTTLAAGWDVQNCHVNVFVYKDNVPMAMAEVQNAITFSLLPPTGVTAENNGTPVAYELSQNYPNPFNPTTNVRLAVAKTGHAIMKVFDVAGREVLVGVDEVLEPGYYNVEIDASKLASGVYFYTFAINDFATSRKMVLLK